MPPYPPRTSSTVHPLLQNTSRIDSVDNPEIMGEYSESEKKKGYHIPLLRFRVNDVGGDGAEAFFGTGFNVAKLMQDAVVGVLTSLYSEDNAPTNVRSVTLILRSMGGVAYTTGSDLDSDHKEIHFSTDYIAGVNERSKGSQTKQEILGVLRHEMVHCFQYNAHGTCNGGLIEGIADWVRYKAGFIPPHWHPGNGDEWDNGYEKTAFFLLWLEEQYGAATVPRINGWLKKNNYSDNLFTDLFGEKPEALWKKYKQTYAGGGSSSSSKSQISLVTPKDTPDDESTKSESYVEVPAAVAEAENGSNGKLVSLFQISEARMIARARLSTLVYTATHNHGSDGLLKFIRRFESLVDVVDTTMSEKERKALLMAALPDWALEKIDIFDPEDTKTFADIKQMFKASF